MSIRALLQNLQYKEEGNTESKDLKIKKKDSKLQTANWHAKQKKNSRQVKHNLTRRMGK